MHCEVCSWPDFSLEGTKIRRPGQYLRNARPLDTTPRRREDERSAGAVSLRSVEFYRDRGPSSAHQFSLALGFAVQLSRPVFVTYIISRRTDALGLKPFVGNAWHPSTQTADEKPHPASVVVESNERDAAGGSRPTRRAARDVWRRMVLSIHIREGPNSKYDDGSARMLVNTQRVDKRSTSKNMLTFGLSVAYDSDVSHGSLELVSLGVVEAGAATPLNSLIQIHTATPACSNDGLYAMEHGDVIDFIVSVSQQVRLFNACLCLASNTARTRPNPNPLFKQELFEGGVQVKAKLNIKSVGMALEVVSGCFSCRAGLESSAVQVGLLLSPQP